MTRPVWVYSPSVSFQTPKTSSLRSMTKKDVPVVHRLLREYLSQFNLVPAMNQEEVEHWLLPRDNIIDTYLVEVNVQITISSPRNILFSSGRFLVTPVCWRLPERWKSDGFPEFLHSALHHYEPPRAPQPKSSIFLLQRAHGHTFAGPDARCSHPGKIGACPSSPGLVGDLFHQANHSSVFSCLLSERV